MENAPEIWVYSIRIQYETGLVQFDEGMKKP